jgi:uncharacterized membrane protein
VKKNKTPKDASAKNALRRIEHEAEGGASGAIAGALVGAAAGPPGALAGAIIGAVAGALAGAVLDKDSSESDERTRELDDDIGVTSGTIGAPNLKHPPPTGDSYAAPSSATTDGPKEGPPR